MVLSIIILSYKQKGLIRQSLKGLKSLNIPFNYEIIVVDNNSGDSIREMLGREFMEVKLIEAAANRGYAAGNNLGIQAAKGRYLLILNPDITILGDAITQLVEFMDNHPRSGICGPKVLNADNSLQYTCSRFPDWRLPFFRRTFLGQTGRGKKWSEDYLMMDWDHNQDKQVDWLFGACLMVRREAINEVGPLDERYFLYMEDLDWCRRFWDKAWEVWYVASAEVIHYHQRLSAEGNLFTSLFSRTARMHLSSWIKYFLKFRKNQKK